MIADEPTNHLDLESIQSLNNSFIDYKGSLLFYSHDHEFMNTVANRVIEIGPNGMVDKHCTYDEYLEDESIAERRVALYTK
jgi:ATPase subunit of ABC transporter with duplicated ATPase domains